MLNKYIFALFFCFFIVKFSFGQSFSAEISAGLTANQVDGDNLSGYNKAGIYAGFGVSFPLSDKVALKPELLFVQKGSRTTEKNAPSFFIWRINYLELPLTIQFSLTEKFYAFGGAAADILISSSTDIGGGFKNNSMAMQKVNPVTVFGFGYRLTDRLSFNARHLYSITQIDQTRLRQYNNSIAVYLSLGL